MEPLDGNELLDEGAIAPASDAASAPIDGPEMSTAGGSRTVEKFWELEERIMGNGAKIGLVGVLALIVLVVALWDKRNEDQRSDAGRSVVGGALPGGGRVKSLREASPGDDTVRGEMNHTGPLVTRAPLTSREAAPQAGSQATVAPIVAPPAPAVPAPQVVAAPTPPPATAPVDPAAPRKYTLQARDTLSSIAAAFYGDKKKWKTIYDANKTVITDPDRLPLGKEIVIPTIAPAPKPAAKPATAVASSEPKATTPLPASAKKTHVVQHGETLGAIAAKETGNKHNWQKIYEANKDKIPDANKLKEGVELIIP